MLNHNSLDIRSLIYVVVRFVIVLFKILYYFLYSWEVNVIILRFKTKVLILQKCFHFLIYQKKNYFITLLLRYCLILIFYNVYLSSQK